MSKILFIAYNFPPCGGPGVQRSLKYVKYLSKSKYKIIIHTTYENSYPVLDNSLIKDIPNDILIYRAKTFDINKFRIYFSKIGLGKIHGFLNTLFAIPDTAVFWSFFSRKTVKKIILEHNPDIIYTTSGPYSAHLLGLWIKKKYNIPWIADFRDPWSLNQFVKYLPLYRKINRYLEQKVLTNADKIICVSELDSFNFSNLAKTKNNIEVIHNGFDKDDFNNFGDIIHNKNNIFTILYTGNFSSTRKPTNLIQAIRYLYNENLIENKSIKLVFAGSNLERFLTNDNFITNLGYVEHSKLETLRKTSNLLLLLQDSSIKTIGDYSGKIFEYIASGIPILAITNPNSVVVNLINTTNTGFTVEDDIISIAKCILNIYNDYNNNTSIFQPNWNEINKYSREESTNKLIKLINQLA